MPRAVRDILSASCKHQQSDKQFETYNAAITYYPRLRHSSCRLIDMHNSKTIAANWDVCRQIEELTHALRASRVPIAGPFPRQAITGTHNSNSFDASSEASTATHKLAAGSDGGAGRHAGYTGTPTTEEKQETCDHDWQPDGQTMTAVRWTCSRCGKSELRGVDI